MLLILAIAPVTIFLSFIYIKDKYEKEPLILLGLGVLYGLFLVAPVIQIDLALLESQWNDKFPALFQAFITSAGNEEGLKWIFMFFLIYKNPNFNEPVDGIVYAVFISLGFAMGENVIYVYNEELGGIETALMRCITSVPAHMMFAISMGYYFAKWRYLKEGVINLFLSFLAPWSFHGFYNYILLSEINTCISYLVVFVPYYIYLVYISIKKFHSHLSLSPYKFLKKH